jgi:hypothetical protein
MQRKVFRIGGEAVLATREGSLFETAGTLARLIEEGERQRRDLVGWREAAPVGEPMAREPEAPVVPEAEPNGDAAEAAPAGSPIVPQPVPAVRNAAPSRSPHPRWVNGGRRTPGPCRPALERAAAFLSARSATRVGGRVP